MGDEDRTMRQIREADIRPPHLEAEARRLAEADARRLLLQRHEFVSVDCPACRSADAVPQFEKGGFDFRECRRCGTLFISPRPTAALLQVYYAEAEGAKFWNRHVFPASADIRRERIFRPRLRLVADVTVGRPVDTLVDVGAGFGWFAALCVEEGLARRVIAVEPNPELADSCRRTKAVEVIEAPIEECHDLLAADVITCFELIEHLFDPFDLLRACRQGLRRGGLFICTTPNWEGFDVALLRARSDNVAGPRHLQLFTPRALRGLLERVGFGEVVISTPGQLDVDIFRNKIVGDIFGAAELPFFGRLIRDGSPEFRHDLQQLLQRHGLSSNMMAVGRALAEGAPVARGDR